jgi:hypothetical protein
MTEIIDDLEIVCSGKFIESVRHKCYYVNYELMQRDEYRWLKEYLGKFLAGLVPGSLIWTDGDKEEPSTRVYFSIDSEGFLKIITELEELIRALNTETITLYVCDIEDSQV